MTSRGGVLEIPGISNERALGYAEPIYTFLDVFLYHWRLQRLPTETFICRRAFLGGTNLKLHRRVLALTAARRDLNHSYIAALMY